LTGSIGLCGVLRTLLFEKLGKLRLSTLLLLKHEHLLCACLTARHVTLTTHTGSKARTAASAARRGAESALLCTR
jgi:hypothetical protein